MKNSIQKIIGIIITVILIGGMIFWRAWQNHTRQNYRHANFFVFWLSGKLILEEGNPYNPVDWQNGHELYGSTTPNEEIFLYPLPMAVFMAPLGLFTLDDAYLGWQILSQVLITVVIFSLLNQWDTSAHRRLLIPLMLFLLFFGPLYLTLQIGSIGPITLLLIFIVMILLQKNISFAAGLLLALTMLKPPQGLTLLLLLGIWLLARRDWKAISGIVLGGIILWVIGASVDLEWVAKFQQSSGAAFDRRLGFQPNILSITYVMCKQNMFCTYTLGGAGALLSLGVTAYYLWRKHAKLTVWKVFNLVIPIAFVTTVYLWGYDQIMFVIPIVWVIGTLVERTKSYIYAFIFLIVLDVFSFYALLQQAITAKDLWSFSTTVIVLGAVLGLTYLNKVKPIDKPSSPA